MAILLSATGLGHAFGIRPLFDGVSFTLSEGDRVGLIGPNGAGKSTLLKILAGVYSPDRGTIAKRGGLRIGHLAQTPEFPAGVTIHDAVSAGLRTDTGHEAWEGEAKVDQLLARLDLADGPGGTEAKVETLSGGWQKRVALARALVSEPELLLLDEPTNHLDVESILWLEKLLATARFATVTVTHDRLFLQRVANRILELDRRNDGGVLDVAGDYAAYVDRKAFAMAAQENRETVLRNTLRRETEWLRRGPPARSTKQQARIKRAGDLADEVGELGVRNQVRGVDLDFQGIGRKPKRLIEAQGISKSFGPTSVFDNIDLFIGPGSRLGLLGPNGCGKSTLLRILIGNDTPTTGQVMRAESLQVAWFEQDRGSLDPNLSVVNTVCPDGDYVEFRGARVHRIGYLERFLFRDDQMTQPVSSLSGGEQARLLVARLMLRPANVLVLDEPTNDLDLATLSVLEDALTSFDGAVLLVTHDRYFLDQVATQILAFHANPDERGQVTSFSGLQQWEEWHVGQGASRSGKNDRKATDRGGSVVVKKKKLTFKEQREWETIEARIADAEAKATALEAELSSSAVATNVKRLLELQKELDAARLDVESLFARWAALEALQTGA